MRQDFFLYMRHEDEKENIINTIVCQAREGNTSFTFEASDDFSGLEWDEIRAEVERRLYES